MHFYNLTLVRGRGISHAICGNFIGNNDGTEQEQIVSCSVTSLTLWILKTKRKGVKMKKVLDLDLFGCVHSMAAFRPIDDCKGMS